MANHTSKLHFEEKDLLKKNALPIGTVLSSKSRTYKITKVLGAGGFGITYKVSSKTLVGNIEIDTQFAIKEYFMKGCYRDSNDAQMLYSPTLKLDVEQGREDFITEAKRLNKLSGQSNNIVKVNELFTANDTAYYVMEYLNGGDLIQYVKKNGVLSERDALSIMIPIAKAVELLHNEKLLHLDIKPDNIVLKTDNETQATIPVLIDFGIAKHFGRDGKPTSHLVAKGATDGYAPMEQYADIDRFAPEIDIYALGATLYYLLTGKNPPKAFDIESMSVIRNALPKQVSEQTKNMIVSAMQRNKSDRTSSVHQMLSGIDCSISSLKNRTLPLNHQSKSAISRLSSLGHLNKKYIGLILSVLVICLLGYGVWRWIPSAPSDENMKIDTLSNVTDTIKQPEPSISTKETAENTNEPFSNGSVNPTVASKAASEPVAKTETDAEKFEKAYRAKDWATLHSLADKGYSKAYIPLAKHYLETDATHHLADKYARKALSVGITEANNVIDMLNAYGYYE